MTDQQEIDLIDVDDIDGGFVPRLKDTVSEVSDEELEDQYGVVDAATGRVLSLNESAALICDFMDGERTLDVLIADLAQAVGLERQALGDDVTGVVRRLGHEGMLAGVRPGVIVRAAPEPPASVPEGTEVAEFSLLDLSGALVSREVLTGRKTLLVNWSPSCGWCDRIAPDLVGLHDDLAGQGVDVVLLASGTAEANASKVAELGLQARVLLNPANEVDLFGSMGTPAAYLLDEQARVAGALALGGLAVPALAAELAGRTT